MSKEQPQYYLAEIDELIPYARNARKHSKEQIAQIAASIKEFGFLSPVIIAKDNTILCGHGRFFAAQKLGLTKVPCIKEVEPTITARGPGAVAQSVYSSNKASFFCNAEKELANTLVATDYKEPPLINEKYIVRRLTPTECARLQGFPDWWCADLGTENPTDKDMGFWREVFETHRKIIGHSSKQKTDKQIIKWLKNPRSDSAEYKMWGNGVALPCVYFVLSGIAWYTNNFDK